MTTLLHTTLLHYYITVLLHYYTHIYIQRLGCLKTHRFLTSSMLAYMSLSAARRSLNSRIAVGGRLVRASSRRIRSYAFI